jgi:hypothetical protein
VDRLFHDSPACGGSQVDDLGRDLDLQASQEVERRCRNQIVQTPSAFAILATEDS